jgi:hypothetical protein
MDKLLILFKDKIFKEPIEVGKFIVDRLKVDWKIYCSKCGEEERKKLNELLGESEVPVEFGGDMEEILEKERPFLTVIPKPDVSPLIHAFRKPWSEKLVEDNEEYNFLLVKEGNPSIDKVLLYVDRDSSSEDYIRNTYQFLTKLGVEFKFTTVFDERYFILLLKKEHPEQEAKELLRKMFEDYINQVREKIEKTLGLEKVEILLLKGEVGKTLPYFAKKHGYNLLVISHAYDTKKELVENSETSVAVFRG